MYDKQRVLIISESMAGGLRKHVVQLIENLPQSEYEIYFIHGTETLDETFLAEYDQLKKYATIIQCPTLGRKIKILDDVKAYLFIRTQIAKIHPDIVHCHSSKAGVLGRLAAKYCGVKKVFYTPHAYSFLSPEFSKQKKIVFSVIERLLSRHATTLTLCVSNGEKTSALQRRIDCSQKIAVVYNGLAETNKFTREHCRKLIGVGNQWKVIGNNARMSEQKNPILFFKIAEKVLSYDESFMFVWAGDGRLMPVVQHYVKEHDLVRNVKLLGDRDDSEKIVPGLFTSVFGT